MSLPVALDIVEESIALLEKAAREADALEADNKRLREELDQMKLALRTPAKQASATFDRGLLLKVANFLEAEHLLPEHLNAEKLASLYESNPNHLLQFTLRLLSPATAEGQPIGKVATEESPDTMNVVTFEGRQVVDHDGWVNVIKR